MNAPLHPNPLSASSSDSTDKPPLALLIAAPRGFCAGVDRAIEIVERALEKYGAPVYVRHEIVHNRYVVDALREKGAVFVEELDEVPDGAPVVFSAHGVPKSVPAEADRREMLAALGSGDGAKGNRRIGRTEGGGADGGNVFSAQRGQDGLAVIVAGAALVQSHA